MDISASKSTEFEPNPCSVCGGPLLPGQVLTNTHEINEQHHVINRGVAHASHGKG